MPVLTLEAVAESSLEPVGKSAELENILTVIVSVWGISTSLPLI